MIYPRLYYLFIIIIIIILFYYYFVIIIIYFFWGGRGGAWYTRPEGEGGEKTCLVITILCCHRHFV